MKIECSDCKYYKKETCPMIREGEKPTPDGFCRASALREDEDE